MVKPFLNRCIFNFISLKNAVIDIHIHMVLFFFVFFLFLYFWKKVTMVDFCKLNTKHLFCFVFIFSVAHFLTFI